jgi:hypothetical protein
MLYYIILYYSILYIYHILLYIIFYYIIICYIILYYILLQYIILYCIILHYIILYYIIYIFVYLDSITWWLVCIAEVPVKSNKTQQHLITSNGGVIQKRRSDVYQLPDSSFKQWESASPKKMSKTQRHELGQREHTDKDHLTWARTRKVSQRRTNPHSEKWCTPL